MTLETQDLKTIATMIRTFRDRKGQTTVTNTLTFNPQTITASNNPAVFGPYYFNTQFQSVPVVIFGAYRNTQQDQAANGSQPFVCMPYVDSLVFSGGAPIGMNVGVLGLTAVPSGLTQYTLAWLATGKGSSYKLERQGQSYTQSYSSNTASHLYTNANGV